jgi:hypothetical protein
MEDIAVSEEKYWLLVHNEKIWLTNILFFVIEKPN